MEGKKKNTAILGAIGVVAVAIIVVVLAGNSGTKNKASLAEHVAGSNQQNQATTMETKTLSDGLQITDEVVGTGTEAVAGDTVTVNYVGSLADGKIFDASANHGNQGFTFVLGAGQVIKGWDEGVAGMRVGGKRKLVIPPSLGYGSQSVGNGLIPPNSTLVFQIELLGVQSAGH